VGLLDQVTLDKLLARGWRSCGAHSFRAGNHNNAELAGQLDQKLDKNGDVAGFYTNLTDGAVQSCSRGGLQSRPWQALESATVHRKMPGPIFAMFLLLTGTHENCVLIHAKGLSIYVMFSLALTNGLGRARGQRLQSAAQTGACHRCLVRHSKTCFSDGA
jgi:hypothetical protein